MIFGGALGYYGWPLPMVEVGIGASAIVMCLAIAFDVRLPTIAAMVLVGLFAIFHGHAHGSEGAGLGISFLPYAAGFVAATATLSCRPYRPEHRCRSARQCIVDHLKKVRWNFGVIAGASLLAGWLTA